MVSLDGGTGIFIGTGTTATVNILNSYIHDNNGDGIFFDTWYGFTQTNLFLPIDQPLYQPYAANVFNTDVVDNQGVGLDYYGMGTLTVCGGSLSGNGENIYVELPGVLVQDPYYPCGWSEDVQTPGDWSNRCECGLLRWQPRTGQCRCGSRSRADLQLVG